ATPPAVQQDRRDRAEESAVPDEAAAPQQRGGLAGEKDIPELGADEPADHARDHDVGGIVFVQPALAQVELNRPPGHQEGHHHHEPVPRELERAETEDERIDGHEPTVRRASCVVVLISSPGKGRSARASSVQSLRSPRFSRYQPARAIIAALSALRRGLATATRAWPLSR